MVWAWAKNRSAHEIVYLCGSVNLSLSQKKKPFFSICFVVDCFFSFQIEPKITSRGDIIYPLNVVLDSLPALTRRMRLSVNVWTPELDAFQAQPFQKGDFKRYLVNLDPEELIEESRNAWRCIGKVYLTVGIQTCQCSLLYGLKLKPRKVLCILCKKLQVLKITL